MDDNDTPIDEKNRDRNLEMLRAYLLGAPVRRIAEDFGLSPSYVYQIKTDEKWHRSKSKIDRRGSKRVTREVEKTLDAEDSAKSINYNQQGDGRWYFEVRMVPTGEGPKMVDYGFEKDDPLVCVGYPDPDPACNHYILRYFVPEAEVLKLKKGQRPPIAPATP